MQSGIKDVDQAHLPQVQDVRREFAVLEDGALAHCLQEQEIEQYYASNIQKNRLVQKDIRVARKLQDEEAKQGKSTVVEQQKEIAERDSEYARAIQEEIRKQLEESKRREEEDKEIARRLQEEEEREQQRLQIQARRLGDGESPVRDRGSSGKSYNPDILEWRVGKLGLKDNSQLFEDEVLARRLQEEEERHLVRTRTWSLQKQEEDFLAAQVAQDEEIAKYMQKRELKSRRWPREAEMSPRKAELSPKEVRSNPEETEPCPREARLKHRDAEYGWQQREDADGDSDSSERRRNSRSRKLSNEVPTTHQKRLDSGSLPSRTEDEHPGRSDSPTQTTTASGTDRTSYICPKNIAEELDPTFKAKDKERSGEAAPVTPPAATKSPSVPVDGFFDYMDESTEPVFIPPTKRQTDKAGHQKSREKKEGCKQQ
ncbi:coiled-coil domain-containing protein 50-like isoform X4 [Protopterus annectens]|uniref:coiled-coil domain-containing protein 50-like isoform X4 n=1 Tax=Protopterus annectens TaxID=7888 RepID=UPI001CFBCF2D|nr:coiled-coil domain-containing protein 50-like isoform X4 [Protopterus annectens]